MDTNVKQFTGNFASRLTTETAAQLNEIGAKAAAEGIKIESGADMLGYLITLANKPVNAGENTPQTNEGEILIVVNEAEYTMQTEFWKDYGGIDIEALKNEYEANLTQNELLSEELKKAIAEAGKYVNGEFLAVDDKALELVWAVYTKRKEAGKKESLQSLIAAIFRLVMMPKINSQIDITEKLSAREYLLNLPPAMQNMYK